MAEVLLEEDVPFIEEEMNEDIYGEDHGSNALIHNREQAEGIDNQQDTGEDRGLVLPVDAEKGVEYDQAMQTQCVRKHVFSLERERRFCPTRDSIGEGKLCDVCREADSQLCGCGRSVFLHCQHKCPEIVRHFTRQELGFIVFGLVLYVWDIVSDLMLAMEYFNQGDVIWGSLTLSFVLTA